MRRNESGQINFGCIVAIVLILAGVIVAAQALPAKSKVSDFDAAIVAVAERAALPQFNTVKKIKRHLAAKAGQLNLPVTEDDIQVDLHRNLIKIHVEYDLDLDFFVYKYRWHKVHDVERPIFR